MTASESTLMSGLVAGSTRFRTTLKLLLVRVGVQRERANAVASPIIVRKFAIWIFSSMPSSRQPTSAARSKLRRFQM